MSAANARRERCSCEKARFNSFFQGRVVNPPLAHSQWTVQYAPGALPLQRIPHSSKSKNGTLFLF
jgi:hypothetical protein